MKRLDRLDRPGCPVGNCHGGGMVQLARCAGQRSSLFAWPLSTKPLARESGTLAAAKVMQALGDNMGRGQKVMEQLVQSVESALSLATHAEGWTWKEETPQGITQ